MKNLTKILMVVLAAAMLFGCSAAPQATPSAQPVSAEDNSWKYIQEKGEFIVGLDDTFAPMGFRDENGNLVGFDIDLATAVCEEMGVKVKFQPIDWDAKEMELSGKKIDCIWNGMSITPERKESMLLSKPYLNNTLVIMYKKDGVAVDNKADMVGKKIGVQAKSAALEALEKETNYDELKLGISEYATYDEAIMDLEIGRIDAIVIDEVLGRYKLAKKDNIVIASDKFADDLYAIGMRKGEEALGAELEKAMKTVVESGKGKEISEKWFGEDIIVK